MSELVRYCGNETRDLDTFVFNHYTKNPERNGRHGEPENLAASYRNALVLAAENLCQPIAFPCISTGVYGYPIEDAAKIAVREVRGFLFPAETQRRRGEEREVIFCCFSERDKNVYANLIDKAV